MLGKDFTNTKAQQKDSKIMSFDFFILLPWLQYLSISRKPAKVAIQSPKALLKLKSQES